jgi:hypothetical protein
VRELLENYQRPLIAPEVEEALLAIARREAKIVGLKQ